jgi:hypothetical protein
MLWITIFYLVQLARQLVMKLRHCAQRASIANRNIVCVWDYGSFHEFLKGTKLLNRLDGGFLELLEI